MTKKARRNSIYKILIGYILGTFLGICGGSALFLHTWYILPHLNISLSIIVVVTSLILSAHAIFTLIWMLYTWENPMKAKECQSPHIFEHSKISFSAIIPARNEVKVIGDTIKAVSNINYPEELKEIIVVCRYDDENTIQEVRKTRRKIGKTNIRLLIYYDLPINKPHCLNIGLAYSKKQVITIFDAEDQPHRDIYNVVNTLMLTENADVVQSGVQLMNYRSHWFSSINVLEYFFWFKSGLHFFSKIGNVTPLGGNTVFFKKECLDKVKGWDENCLTEDADIGIRLVNQGINTRIVYDEQHVTKEETPDSISAFIKQRTRWNHGFLQILLKGDWQFLPTSRQRIMALYILIAPMMQIGYLIYLPFGIWIATHSRLPMLVSLLSFMPAYMFILQITAYFVGVREFVKTYSLKYSLWDSLKIIIVFLPYQIMVTIASFRAMSHLILSQNIWEKTNHVNAHREINIGFLFPNYTINYVG